MVLIKNRNESYDTLEMALPIQLTFTYLKLTIETIQNGVKKCSKLTMKILERRHSRHAGVFIVDFEHISHLF